VVKNFANVGLSHEFRPLLSMFYAVIVWAQKGFYTQTMTVYNCTISAETVRDFLSPLSSNRQHYHNDDCLEDNREDY